MKWTTLEEQYLLNNYEHVANADLAKKLNRSLTTVQRKLCNMGLKRTDEQLRVMRQGQGENYGGVPMEEVLTPQQCEVMRDFLQKAVWAHRLAGGDFDANKFIWWYRTEEMGGELRAN